MKGTFFQVEGKEARSVHTIAKVFLITGGTPESRKEKYRQLYLADELYAHRSYEGENELAIIFSVKYEDFDYMTFDKAKKLAGNTVLGGDFSPNTFGTISSDKGPAIRFGVINLPEPEPEQFLRSKI